MCNRQPIGTHHDHRTDHHRHPVVHVKNGEVFANSRDVADFFGKRHDHVIRDLNNLLMGLPKSGDTPFNWLRPVTYVAANGEIYGSYDMTRDVFTLLVMGYTGAKAMEFNEMEAKLRQPVQPALPNFANLHSVARFARTIPGINANATKRDLLRAGYLYKQGGTYRVYRRFADCFVEKLNEQYGTVGIYVTETGKQLLLGLNALGKLTRLKAARAA